MHGRAQHEVRVLEEFRGPVPGPPEGIGLLEEAGEEALDAVTEVDRAVAHVAPRALGAGLGRLPRLLQLLARVLRSFDHRVADALGRFLGARPDLPVPDLL